MVKLGVHMVSNWHPPLPGALPGPPSPTAVRRRDIASGMVADLIAAVANVTRSWAGWTGDTATRSAGVHRLGPPPDEPNQFVVGSAVVSAGRTGAAGGRRQGDHRPLSRQALGAVAVAAPGAGRIPTRRRRVCGSAPINSADQGEVSAVANFCTMYRRRPTGEYLVGVCTNTLCAVMGGDAIFDRLKSISASLRRATSDGWPVPCNTSECNACLEYAPVVMVNWEFFDNQTPESAPNSSTRCAPTPKAPTRGARCAASKPYRASGGSARPASGEGQGGPGAPPGRAAGGKEERHAGATNPGRTNDHRYPVTPERSAHWDGGSWTLATYPTPRSLSGAIRRLQKA